MITLAWTLLIVGIFAYVPLAIKTQIWYPERDNHLPLKPGFTLACLGLVIMFFCFHPLIGLLILVGFLIVAYRVWMPDKFLTK